MTTCLSDQHTRHFQRLEINSVRSANAYITVKNRDKETRIALERYMLQYSAILVNGKFETVYEYNPITKIISLADMDPNKYPGWACVIRKNGMRYVSAWSEEWAIKKLSL